MQSYLTRLTALSEKMKDELWADTLAIVAADCESHIARLTEDKERLHSALLKYKAVWTHDFAHSAGPNRVLQGCRYTASLWENGEHEEAVAIAKQSFDDAIMHLDSLDPEEAYRQSTMMMQVERDFILAFGAAKESEDARKGKGKGKMKSTKDK